MKSKTEINLDKEFEKLGIRPLVYHFVGICPFNAITIVTNRKYITYERALEIINSSIASTFFQSNNVIECKVQLEKQFNGVAICARDQFNRRRGRIIAKGRLLKFLKENKNDNKM